MTLLTPREGHITSVNMRYHHEKVARAGKRIAINELRSQTYLIIKSTSTFKSSPFTYWGIETFRAFLVKDGKYYNEMFINENIIMKCFHEFPAVLCITKLQRT